jgi:hypothetical protein
MSDLADDDRALFIQKGAAFGRASLAEPDHVIAELIAKARTATAKSLKDAGSDPGAANAAAQLFAEAAAREWRRLKDLGRLRPQGTA